VHDRQAAVEHDHVTGRLCGGLQCRRAVVHSVGGHPGPDDELKELSDTFDGLLARLEAAFQAQRQFIANASHELRTPLARQRVLSQVALADPDATVESLRSAHERVLAGGAQLEQLIESLLTLARGQAGISVREPFDLASLTGHVLETRMAAADTAQGHAFLSVTNGGPVVAATDVRTG
jgi:signal transduction histidine kinase